MSIWLAVQIEIRNKQERKGVTQSLWWTTVFLYPGYVIENFNYSSLANKKECHMHGTFIYNFYKIFSLALLLFFISKISFPIFITLSPVLTSSLFLLMCDSLLCCLAQLCPEICSRITFFTSPTVILQIPLISALSACFISVFQNIFTFSHRNSAAESPTILLLLWLPVFIA